MKSPTHILLHDYGWIHLFLGLAGNIAFFIGSLFFLSDAEHYKTLGTWLFVFGSFFMLIGATGRLCVDLRDRHRKQ